MLITKLTNNISINVLDKISLNICTLILKLIIFLPVYNIPDSKNALNALKTI